MQFAESVAAQLRLVKLHLNKLEDLWNNGLRTDESKVETFGHSAQTPRTNCQHRRRGEMIWASYNHRIDHKHVCIPKYSRLKCETVSLTAKASQKLSWMMTIYDRMAEKEKILKVLQ